MLSLYIFSELTSPEAYPLVCSDFLEEIADLKCYFPEIYELAEVVEVDHPIAALETADFAKASESSYFACFEIDFVFADSEATRLAAR